MSYQSESVALFVELRKYWRKRLCHEMFMKFTLEISGKSIEEVINSPWVNEKVLVSLSV